MKKIILFSVCVYLFFTHIIFVFAQSLPTTHPGAFYGYNKTSVPLIIKSSYWNKFNSGENILFDYWWKNTYGISLNSQQYVPYTIAGTTNTGVGNIAAGAINVRIMFPPGYNNAGNTKKYPVVLFLHGRGENGTYKETAYGSGSCTSGNCLDNNEKSLQWWGKEQIMANNGGYYIRNSSGALEPYQPYLNSNPAIYIVPQNSFGTWIDGHFYNFAYLQYINPATGQPWAATYETKVVLELMDYLSTGNAVASDGTKFRVDANRIYIHGLSAGCLGTYDMLYRRTDLFAGAIPYSGGGDISDYIADKVKYTPIWMWQGAQDDNPAPQTSYYVYQSYINDGINKQVRNVTRDKNYRDVDYGTVTVNDKTYTSVNYYYGNKRYTRDATSGHTVWYSANKHPDVLRWLFSQNKLNITAFGDTSLCFIDSLKIGIHPDFAAYQWKKDTVTLSKTTNDLYVKDGGKYYVRIKRKNNFTGQITDWTEWSAPIQIIGKPGKPTITVNGSLILPSASGNTVTLSAPAGNGYVWSDGTNNVGTTQNITVSKAGNYTVRVTNQSNCQSIQSDPVKVIVNSNPDPTIATPTNLSASGLTIKSISLSWADNATNETTYEIYRATVSGGPYTALPSQPANTTAYISDNLIPGTLYYYKIRAVNASGASAYSDEVSSEPAPDVDPPTAPANLTANSISATGLTIYWVASTDNIGVTAYNIYKNGVLAGTSATTSFAVTGLSPSTSYIFTVTAKDAKNNTSPSSLPLNAMTNGFTSCQVKYSYYQSYGNFTTMPDFNTLTLVKTGTDTNFTLTNKNRDEYFQFKYESSISTNASGVYTFYTNSDDGSQLFIDNRLVVNNEGKHKPLEKSDTITLTAGYHDIKVLYYNLDGFAPTNPSVLQVSWKGPGFDKQFLTCSNLLSNPTYVNFYPKPTGDLNNLSTWGTNPDGSGIIPVSFKYDNQNFFVNRIGTLNSNYGDWDVSGLLSVVSVTTTGNLTIPYNVKLKGTAKVNVDGNGILTLQNAAIPNIGTLSFNSTVDYTNGLSVQILPYGNLRLSGSGNKTFQAGTYSVANALKLDGGTVVANANTVLNLAGSIVSTANVPLTFTVNCVAPNQTFTGNGNTITINKLNLNNGTIVNLSSAGGNTGLTIKAAITLATGSVLNIDKNLLTLNGAAIINSGGETGMISTNRGSIYIDTYSASNANLYFSPTANLVKDLTVSVHSGGNASLQNTMKLAGTLKLLSGELNTNSGQLVLLSDTSGTGRLDKLEYLTSLTGNVTWQRFIPKNSTLPDPNNTSGWFHIGTPVKNQKISDWSDNAYIQGPWVSAKKTSNLLYYREDKYRNPPLPLDSANNYENQGWYGFKSINDTLTPGKGIKMYLYKEFFNVRNSTLDNTGLPVIGDGIDGKIDYANGSNESFNFKITYSPTTGWDGGGWNFLSNPFPSDISWTNIGWTKTNIKNDLYVWDSKANNGKGQYQIHSTAANGQVTITNGATGRIAQGQAFLIKATSKNPALIANENVKTATATSILRTASSELSNSLRITLKNNIEESDETVIRYADESLVVYDTTFDVSKLYGGNINISSLSTDSKDLAINVLPHKVDTIYLNLQNNSIGKYTLNFSGVESFNAGSKLFLLDKFTNKNHNISENAIYSFEINKEVNSYGNQRFALVLSPSVGTFISGLVYSEDNRMISGARVNLLGGVDNSQIKTTKDGNFSFNITKNTDYIVKVDGSTEQAHTISVMDAVALKRHLSGKVQLSPYKLISADIDNDKLVSQNDLKWMHERIVGNTEFIPNENEWNFIPADFKFSDPKNPFPYTSEKLIKPTEDNKSDFIGTQTGALADPNQKSSESLHLSIGGFNHSFGEEVTIPVKISKGKNLSGYQFGLNWNTAILEFVKISNVNQTNQFGINKVSEGLVSVIWNEENGSSKNIEEGSAIFEITFKIISNERNYGFALNFGSVEAMAVNGNLEKMDIRLENPSDSYDKEFNLYQNFPNPLTYETNFGFSIPEDGQVALSIHNSMGQKIDLVTGDYKAGNNTIVWNYYKKTGKSLDNGIYIYSIRFKDKILFKKLIITK